MKRIDKALVRADDRDAVVQAEAPVLFRETLDRGGHPSRVLVRRSRPRRVEDDCLEGRPDRRRRCGRLRAAPRGDGFFP